MKIGKVLVTGALLASLGTGSAVYAASVPGQSNAMEPSHQYTQKGDVHNFVLLKQVADVLHMNPKNLFSELKSGKSLSQVAASKGMNKSTLVSKLVTVGKADLDQAVKSGKLSADKEKKIESTLKARISKLVDQKGILKKHKKHKGEKELFKNAASVLKIDQKTLYHDLKSGKSLTEIAASKGMNKATLITKLVAVEKTDLGHAVKTGKLSAVKEKKIESILKARISKLVDHKGLPKEHKKHKDHRKLFKNAAAILHMNPNTLFSDLKSGKSLTEIAKSKGMSKNTLVAKLVAAEKTDLVQAVKSGKFSAVKEKKIESTLNGRIIKLVDHKGVSKMTSYHSKHKEKIKK